MPCLNRSIRVIIMEVQITKKDVWLQFQID